MRALLWLVLVGIAYGSLYPFNFQLPHRGNLQDWLHPLISLQSTTRGDAISNVVLFVPFGTLASWIALSSAPYRLISGNGLGIIARGLLVALGVQILQIFLPARDPSLVDVIMNGIGMLGGLILGKLSWSILQRVDVRVNLDDPHHWSAILLTAIWLAYCWFPWIPNLHWQSAKAQLQQTLTHLVLSWPIVLHDAGGWAVCFVGLSYLWKNTFRAWHALLFVLLVFTGELFIVDNPLTFSNIIGAMLGWILACTLRNHRKMLGCLILGIIGAMDLLPWEWSHQAGNFRWLPFESLLLGSWRANILAFLEKSFYYGSAVFLLVSSPSSWWPVGLAVSCYIFLLETLQRFQPGRPAEITDVALVIVMVVAMKNLGGFWQNAAQQSARALRLPR